MKSNFDQLESRTCHNVAWELGLRICRDAVWDAAGKRCTWIAETRQEIDGHWEHVYGSFSPTLFDGTSGVAWFLLSLADATDDEVIARTGLGALRQATSCLHLVPPHASFSYYTGHTGVAFAALEAARLGFGEEHRIEARRIVEQFRALDTSTQDLDQLEGLSGAIPPLLAMWRATGDELFVDTARRAGDEVVERAVREPVGCSWMTRVNTSLRNLCGFSHGASGVAWALLELYAELSDESYLRTALDGMAYEDAWFVAAQGNWADLRDATLEAQTIEERDHPAAWCHGAPGMLLPRLRAVQVAGDGAWGKHLDAAIATTVQRAGDIQQGFGLCHGQGGIADILLIAADMRRDEELLRAAHRIARTGVERSHDAELPWGCGTPRGGDTPALLLGHAGIGQLYLRLLDRERYRSPLWPLDVSREGGMAGLADPPHSPTHSRTSLG